MSNAKVTPAQILQTLIDGRALIATPESWTQGVAARDVNGVPIDPLSEGAVCFCTSGALQAVTPYTIPAAQFLWKALDAIMGQPWGPIGYNDTHTHAEVLAVWDKAIELATIAANEVTQ